jgi:hypothetical protein
MLARQPHHRSAAVAALFVGVTALAGCGELGATPDDDEGSVDLFPEGDGRTRAAEQLSPELYGPGADWYDYDSSTHTLTPSPVVYAVRRGGAITLVEIVSYYDDEGESGIFSLRARHHDGATWGEVVEQKLSRNVKDEIVCVRARDLAERPCESDEATLVFRTAHRPLVDAGFAVQEPAIYPMSHHRQPVESRTSITVVAADRIEDVAEEPAELGELPGLPNAATNPSDSLVGPAREADEGAVYDDIHFQVTSHMMAAQWRIAAVDDTDEDTLELTLAARCQPYEVGDTPPFDGEEVEATISLDTTLGYQAALVQLCDPEAPESAPSVSRRSEEPLAGLWPSTLTFDVIVEQSDGAPTVRVAPANLLWNATRANGASGPDALVDPADVPKPSGM